MEDNSYYEINTQENSNISENILSCIYCGIFDEEYLIKCEECNNYFCNGISENMKDSHIIYHLIKSNHKKISINPFKEILICKNEDCKISNIFDLFLNDKNECYCKKHILNTSKNLIENNNKINDNFILKPDSEEHINIIKNCSKNKIISIENKIKKYYFNPQNLYKIQKKYYNIEEYYDLYKNFVIAERNYVKSLYEIKKDIKIELTKDLINKERVKFTIPNYEISFVPGKYLLFSKNSNLNFIGIISYIDNNKNLVYIYPNKSINLIKEGIYYMRQEFSSIPYIRMLNGLNILLNDENCISNELFNSILGLDKIKNINIGNKIVTIIKGYGKLNQSQKNALENIFKKSLNLIQGPPGTGKTFLISFIIYNIFINNQNDKILICAPSNESVDNLTLRLLKINELLDNNNKMKILRIVSKGREYVSYNEKIKKISLHQIINTKNNNNEDYNLKVKKIINEYNIILTTCSTSMDYRLSEINFPFVIIDEATQSKELESILPLIHKSKHITLIGDQNQLRPITIYPNNQIYGMNISLFERMIEIHSNNLIKLNIQYRMHPKIIEYSSKIFYDNLLINSKNIEENRINKQFNNMFNWPRQNFPNIFIHIKSNENFSILNYSYENEKEVELINEIVKKILKCNINPKNIGIITPYNLQREKIRNKINNENILVSSVDSFQGQEKDFIIVSTVRSNLNNKIGFIKCPRRLNVTLTRAKFGLIIIGNAECLSNAKYNNGNYTIWRNLIKYYQDNKVLCSFENGNFKQINNIVENNWEFKYNSEFEWDDDEDF